MTQRSLRRQICTGAEVSSEKLDDGAVCFVGIGLPSEAVDLVRATHAPNFVLIYESGTIGAKPETLPLSIGDGVLAERADSVVSVPEIFNDWLQAGRVDAGSSVAPRSTATGTSTPPSSALTTTRRCACPAQGERPRSPLRLKR